MTDRQADGLFAGKCKECRKQESQNKTRKMLQRSKTNTSFSCCQSSSVIIKHAAACPFPSHLGSRQFLPPNRWQRVASRVRADDCWCVYFAAEADFFVFVIPSNILFEFMFWSDWRSVHVYCAKLVDFHFFFCQYIHK